MKAFNRSSNTRSGKARSDTHSRNTATRVFTQVDYRQFRQHLGDFKTPTVECKGFETIIYDQHGDIQAIVHAASIDSAGRCYPAEYFIRSQALPQTWHKAA